MNGYILMIDDIFGGEMKCRKSWDKERKKDDLNIYCSVRREGQLLLVVIDVESHMWPEQLGRLLNNIIHTIVGISLSNNRCFYI